MFQVASRPFAPEMLAIPAHHQPVVPPSLQLPRNLARPNFNEVSRQTLAALEPELADVPFEYIRKHLAGQANEMLAALSLLSVPTSLPRSRLPPSIDVPLRPTNSMPSSTAFPTHVLAVSSSKSGSSPTTPTAASVAAAFAQAAASPATVPLYPTHALVLAAHCSLMPALPPSRSAMRSATMALPVIPLTVPSAETFQLLHAYLHMKRADTLLASLLPSLAGMLPRMDTASSSSGHSSYVKKFSSEFLLRLAEALASSACSHAGPQGALSGLMNHAKQINGLWRNTCALGVFDPDLWAVMDIAWEVVLAALTRVVERS